MAVKNKSTPQAKPANSELENSNTQNQKKVNNEQYEELAKTALKLSKCSTRTSGDLKTALENSSNAILTLVAKLNATDEKITKISNENSVKRKPDSS